MANHGVDLSLAIFGLVLLLSFLVAIAARHDSRGVKSSSLSEHKLNRWLVGLSAGATANSGFVVTAAVGLGFTYGAKWLLLPVSWLLGDVVFWLFFPQRINAVGRAIHATTMTDIIVDGMRPSYKLWLKRTVAVLVTVCLGGYVAAQWIAGQKFLTGAFGFTGVTSLLTFAALIVIYTAIGGFRGSVYVDSMQALIRILGTSIAIVAVWVIASRSPASFWQNIHAAGPEFLQIFPHNSVWAAVPFVLGFAAAALGFGLGQPQMVSRYLAGASPKETQAAWKIYNFFVQFTWIAMTAFGIALRGVMPNISDPEMGLSLFFRAYTGAIFTGIIVADIFSTIAATSNSLLVAIAQTLSRDLLRLSSKHPRELWSITALVGAASMIASLNLHSTVLSLALSSISIMGAALAPAFAIRVLKLPHTSFSLTMSILLGVGTASAWKYCGFDQYINETAPGMLISMVTNFLTLGLTESGKNDDC